MVITCGWASCHAAECEPSRHQPGGDRYRPEAPGRYCAPNRCYCGRCPSWVPVAAPPRLTPPEAVPDLVASRRRLALDRLHAEALAIEARLTARATAQAITERMHG